MNVREAALLRLMKPVIPFLTFNDIAKLILLNKTMIYEVLQNPYILMYAMKKYYTNPEVVNLYVERFFKSLLTKWMRLDETENRANFRDAEELITAMALRKIEQANLLIPPTLGGNMNDWKIERNGGNGWLMETCTPHQGYNQVYTTSFSEGRMGCAVRFSEFSKSFQSAFEKKRAVIRAGTWIKRRPECMAMGGC